METTSKAGALPIMDILGIMSELQRIPRATWRVSDPSIPPVLRPPRPVEVEPVGRSPVFDDAGFTVPASPEWEEAVSSIGARVSPGGRLRDGSSSVGLDALAWYVSFHSHPERWGIYIPLSSLPITDSLHFSELPQPRTERWRLVWDVLLAHESVHFAMDYACAWFELLYHAPIRRAMCDRMDAGMAKGVFPDQSSYLEVEEALANGHALRHVMAHAEPEVAEALCRFIRGQPPGYRDGELAQPDEGFAATVAETLRSYLSVWSSGWNIDPGNPALDLPRLLPLDDKSCLACPVWVVHDLASVGLPEDAVRFFTRVQPIEETESFNKRFRRLHPDHQRAWTRLKEGLAVGIPNDCDFKKWKPDKKWKFNRVWSFRVTGNIRAHLRQPVPGDAGHPWSALKIGPHTEMGHG